jgi:uncharacterized membrane protein YdjX (TVP38/TMEM64 family)
MKKVLPKIFFIVFILFLIILFKYFNLGDYLTLTYIKDNQNNFAHYYSQHKIQTLSLYFIIYILTTAISLPGAAVLTLAAGSFFGLFTGVLLVSFASTIGATLAFLISRFLLRDFIQKKLSKYISPIKKGI